MKNTLNILLVCLLVAMLAGCQKEPVSYEDEPIEITKLETSVEASEDAEEGSNEATDEASDEAEASDKNSVEEPSDAGQENSNEESSNEEDNASSRVEDTANEQLTYTIERTLYQEEAKVDVILKAVQNSKVIWEKTWPNIYISELDPHSDYTVHDDRIYIEVHGDLFGMNRMTGEELFDAVPIGVTERPLVDTDGSIYCEGYYGPFITKISPEGNIVWQVDDPQSTLWPMGIELDENYVYIHYENFDSKDYNMAQHRKSDGFMTRSFWLEENEVYFGMVEASSTLQGYPVEYLLDGLKTTGWVEGKDDYGIGETLTFKSDSVKAFNKILIENGYHKSDSLYDANGKVKRLRVTAADGRTFDFDMSSSMEPIELLFDERIATTSIELKILDVYPGEKYTDTVITSVSFILE